MSALALLAPKSQPATMRASSGDAKTEREENTHARRQNNKKEKKLLLI
jgi:hypothetical protein